MLFKVSGVCAWQTAACDSHTVCHYSHYVVHKGQKYILRISELRNFQTTDGRGKEDHCLCKAVCRDQSIHLLQQRDALTGIHVAEFA